MPSSLVNGPLFKFLRIGKKLTVGDAAVLHLTPRDAPASGVRGDVYVGTDGKLYVHNGTAFVVAGSQTT